jgi:profilin
MIQTYLVKPLPFLSNTFQGDGAILVKTKKAILIAEYTAPIQAPEATTVAENLADYLISVSY